MTAIINKTKLNMHLEHATLIQENSFEIQHADKKIRVRERVRERRKSLLLLLLLTVACFLIIGKNDKCKFCTLNSTQAASKCADVIYGSEPQAR